jgi:NADH-quinone oxidoreductase subunit J
MVLAHRERTSPKPTQRDLAKLRVASGHPTPLPSPGVFALHNAVDMPALLPDGSPSELSVSSLLARRELVDDGAPALPPAPPEAELAHGEDQDGTEPGDEGPDGPPGGGGPGGPSEPVEASSQGGAGA